MRLLGTLLLALAVLGCGSDRRMAVRPPIQGGALPRVDPAEAGASLVEAHNRIRERDGLSTLVADPLLEQAAEAHARDMAARGRMSHRGGDGSNPAQRVERAGFAYSAVAENVAYGQSTVEEVMDAWMRSSGHRRNILGAYRRIGAACAVGSNGMIYWCVTFGTPKAEISSARIGTAL